jgi:FkbM family methyltransferase
MLGALQRLVREGDVVYDVGANIGLYSRFLVQCFGASKVYAFEPMEGNQELLAKNLELGGCASRVSVIPLAIGNEDGTCEFQVDDLTSNTGSLDVVTGGKASESRAQYGLPPQTVRVPVGRLDSLAELKGIPKPDVIKLDVEGAEALALEGAEILLSQRVCRLVIELHGAEVARKVLRQLWNHGYYCFGLLAKDGRKIYSPLLEHDLEYVQDKYSLHHVLASPNAEELSAPIDEFSAIA